MDDDLYELCLEEVLAALKNKGFSFILKREQDSALRHLFKRKDVVAVLPTGFGKSLRANVGKYRESQISSKSSNFG